MKRKFCLYQIKIREDTENTWTCGAYLTEGDTFECPGDGSDIRFGEEMGKPYVEPCPDFELVSGKLRQLPVWR